MTLNRLLMCGLLLAASLSRADELHAQYEQAIASADQMGRTQKQQIRQAYDRHLDTLIAAAQPQGDIESIVVFLDEKNDPGLGDPPPRLVTARGLLRQQIRKVNLEVRDRKRLITEHYLSVRQQEIESLTRSGRLEEANTRIPFLEQARANLAALQPADEASMPEPPPGPNLLQGGDFEGVPGQAWQLEVPGHIKNRSAFISESNFVTGGAGRNLVLRVEQDAAHSIRLLGPITLKQDAEYEIRWKVRLSRPWRQGIELRGFGFYEVGFSISAYAMTLLPEALLQTLYPQALRRIQPPREPEWVTESIRVRALQHMDQLELRVSPGEGEWILDNIEVREIPPAP